MKTLIVDQQAIKNNISIIKAKAQGAIIYGTLSAHACGLGLVEVARVLRENGIVHFAVTEAAQAAALRNNGFTAEEILMLRSTADRDELERLIDLNVICTVGSYDSGVALNGIAESRSTVVEAHIRVDAGLGNGGFLPSEPDKVLSVFRYMPNIAVTGMYTQIGSAHFPEKRVSFQLTRFTEVVLKVRAEGFDPGILHAASSSALFEYDSVCMDAVRIGSAFWGHAAGSKHSGLQKVGFIEAAADEVRWFPAGSTVTGGVQVNIRKPTKIAVFPIGTADGFCVEPIQGGGLFAFFRRWRATGRLTVRIGTKRAKIIGRTGLLETIVDVTDMDCAPGDIAVFEVNPLYSERLSRIYR